MAEVPENQKISRILETRLNKDFADIAAQLCPSLSTTSRKPQRLVTFERCVEAAFGWRPASIEPVDRLSDLRLTRGGSIILDFGLHMVGFLSFHIEAYGLNIDAPCRLKLIFGETPIDVAEGMQNVETWISTSWLPEEVLTVDFLPEKVTVPRRHACRYVRLDIIDTSPKYSVSLSNVSFECISSINPEQTVELFDYGIPLLNDIDHVSIFTLRDCMQTVFEDGPRRDRRLWIGDLRLQALANYAVFKDYLLVKRCIFMFAALIREDGSLPACLFEKPTLRPATDYIVDYDALFAVVVYEYVEASQDYEAGKMLWSTVCSCLQRALAHVNPETWVFELDRGEGWKFLDWKEDLHRAAGLHGLVLFCLSAVEKLAALLQVDNSFAGAAASIRQAAATFYDRKRGLAVSGPTEQVSLASAAWLTLGKALPRDDLRRILRNVLVHPGRIEPSTPYLWHYVCEALTSVGLFDECLNILQDYWGKMIQAGADTFWECFDPADIRLSPYGDVRNNSFCHAWSCTPTFLLRNNLSGYFKPTVSACTMDELDQEWIVRQVGRG